MKDAVILCSSNRAESYSKTAIKFLGEVNLKLKCDNGEIVEHAFMVVENNVNLIGRDLSPKLNISVTVPSSVCYNVQNVSSYVLDKFRDYLSPNFKSNVQTKVNFEIDPKAIHHRDTNCGYAALALASGLTNSHLLVKKIYFLCL